MEILLNCYANNFVPEIWKDILYETFAKFPKIP